MIEHIRMSALMLMYFSAWLRKIKKNNTKQDRNSLPRTKFSIWWSGSDSASRTLNAAVHMAQINKIICMIAPSSEGLEYVVLYGDHTERVGVSNATWKGLRCLLLSLTTFPKMLSQGKRLVKVYKE